MLSSEVRCDCLCESLIELREFIVPGAEIHMVGSAGQRITATLDELLPRSFGPEFLPR